MITPVQLLRRMRERKGFTLVEVIVASSVFVAVSIIGVTVFVNVMRIQRRIILENAIYEDARFMIERIARDIRYNTIDYEEYYRADASPALSHGEKFGCYAQQFYNPGSDGVIGAQCNDATPLVPGCVVDKNTLDVNTGQNPYVDSGVIATDANALCDSLNHGDTSCILTSADVSIEQSQLFLINPEGTEKTYIGRKQVNTSPVEHAVALFRLTGEDTDTDGIAEKWYDVTNKWSTFASPGYSCPDSITNLDTNLAGTMGGLYECFVPFTPLRTDVTQLRFYISPVEDPRKGFAETDPAEEIQQQPHVTIVMTVKPADSELQGFAGDPPEVTIQTTITSRTYNEVESYLGRDACS